MYLTWFIYKSPQKYFPYSLIFYILKSFRLKNQHFFVFPLIRDLINLRIKIIWVNDEIKINTDDYNLIDLIWENFQYKVGKLFFWNKHFEINSKATSKLEEIRKLFRFLSVFLEYTVLRPKSPSANRPFSSYCFAFFRCCKNA